MQADLILNKTQTDIYTRCGFDISNIELTPESKDYGACKFQLNGLHILCRTAKVTPKKTGQFVVFWKRLESGVIAPFHETDSIDFYVVNCLSENGFGQFVFPKSILIKKGIISTTKKEGKRAFRVYTKWDVVKSKQAQQTKTWQQPYFYEIHAETNLKTAQALYAKQ